MRADRLLLTRDRAKPGESPDRAAVEKPVLIDCSEVY